MRQNYTGYEKDGESELEFAQARYYNPTHGRYTSIDPLTASASIRDPQTFNRYSYVLNSPYKFIDPLGLISETTGACGNRCLNSDGGGGGYSGRDASFDWAGLPSNTVTIDLNIVYNPGEYTRQQAEAATKETVEDLHSTYGAINVKFNITYSEGTLDTSVKDQDGNPAKIATGAKEGAVNAFLYVDISAQGRGRSNSRYVAMYQQIFLSEGSSGSVPKASDVGDRTLSSGALAHEISHLFFQYAGMPTDSLGSNLSQDAGIIYALNQMRYNPLFTPDPELPDSFDYNRTTNGIVSGTFRKTAAKPTYEQLLRIGAKRVSRHLSN